MFGLGAFQGSEHETLDYLGQRIALYFLVLLAMFSLRYYGVVLLGLIQGDLWKELTRPGRVVHLVTIALTASIWRLARRPRLTMSKLAWIDGLGTVAIGVAHACAFGVRGGDQRMIDLTLILLFTQTLVARAAIVPSTPARSLALGSINLSAATIAMYAMGRANFGVSGIPAWVWVYRALEWGGVSLLLTGVISWVIYGLQRRFEQVARLGQYVLHDKIGEGGMGIVYRASHSMLRRPTAIKLLPAERAGASAIQRFEREVQLTATLVHPNTVAVYDFGRTPDGTFYYAMEYLDGIDLERLVALDGPQPPGRVVHILKQICAALGEAHTRGLIHRDIKPANVVLCERGSFYDFAKVVDFGLVKDLAPGTDGGVSTAQAFIGTPHYLAPEAIRGDALVDHRSDLYALGGVAYFLLTGRPVFDGASLVEICAGHLHAPVVPPSDRAPQPVPAGLERVVLACLEKDRGRRPASTEAVVASLESLGELSAWSAADARSWWMQRGPEVRRSRISSPSLADGQTVAVDLRARDALPAERPQRVYAGGANGPT